MELPFAIHIATAVGRNPWNSATLHKRTYDMMMVMVMMMTKNYLGNAAATLGIVRITHLHGDEGLCD